MAVNLDRLLKKIEKNIETAEEQKTYPLEIGGETYEAKTMTRKQKADFIYAQEAGKSNMSIGDIVKRSKKFIYDSLQLSQAAIRAKDAGFIKSYYDVIDVLFEPEQILGILVFIMEINNLDGENKIDSILEGDIEEAKK